MPQSVFAFSHPLLIMLTHIFTPESLMVVGLTLFVLIATLRHLRRQSTFPLPPGPRGYPVIGNLFDMPSTNSQSWLTFAKWGKEYGITYAFSLLSDII
jgi:hypothetical protein